MSACAKAMAGERGKSEHSSSQEEKKAVGNAHRFDGNVKQGKAAQRQYYPKAIWGKGEKHMEVLTLEQSYHIPSVARRCGAKPCPGARAAYMRDIGKVRSLDFGSNVKTR